MTDISMNIISQIMSNSNRQSENILKLIPPFWYLGQIGVQTRGKPIFTHFLTTTDTSMNIISQIMSNSHRQSENILQLIPPFWYLGQIGVQTRGKPIFTHFLTLTDISMNIISQIMSNSNRQSENILKLIPPFWYLGQIGVQTRGKPIFTHFLTITDTSMNIISQIMSNSHRQSENILKLIPPFWYLGQIGDQTRGKPIFTHFLTMTDISINTISQIMSNSNRQSENILKLIPPFWYLGQIGVQTRGKPIFTHFLTLTDISMNIISQIMSNSHR